MIFSSHSYSRPRGGPGLPGKTLPGNRIFIAILIALLVVGIAMATFPLWHKPTP